jgi:hypothetical protein
MVASLLALPSKAGTLSCFLQFSSQSCSANQWLVLELSQLQATALEESFTRRNVAQRCVFPRSFQGRTTIRRRRGGPRAACSNPDDNARCRFARSQADLAPYNDGPWASRSEARAPRFWFMAQRTLTASTAPTAGTAAGLVSARSASTVCPNDIAAHHPPARGASTSRRRLPGADARTETAYSC